MSLNIFFNDSCNDLWGIKKGQQVTEKGQQEPQVNNELIEDSIKALKSLGMAKNRAEQFTKEAIKANPDINLEGIIRLSLKRV